MRLSTSGSGGGGPVEADAQPMDEGHARAAALTRIAVAGVGVEVVTLQAFLEADLRRASSFVTNFGNWLPPADVTASLHADRCRLEWIHDTGELVLLGGVPHVGEAA